MSWFDLKPYLRAKEVVDIRQPMGSIDNNMLVDTNILWFCYYPHYSQLDLLGRGPVEYQITQYPSFLKKLLSSETVLFVHKIGLLEFANTVERAELQLLYLKVKEVSEIGDDFKPKDLRHTYPEQYRIIQGQLATYMHSIKKTFELLGNDIPIDQLLAEFFLEWQDSLADVGDAMMIAQAKLKGISSVLSDDADLASLKDIRLYTANNAAVSAYKAIHKD